MPRTAPRGYMKDEIRTALKIKRKGFRGADRDKADAEILSLFFEHFSCYNSYFVYNSFGTETDTSALIDRLLRADKRVYLPRVEGKELVAVAYGKLRRGAYGIWEPVGSEFTGDIDVSVIPLLAVNPRGFRVGYGGGFYDRYLKGKGGLRIGLGYSFQLVEFKEDIWDAPLDFFVSESGIINLKDNKQ